MLHYSTLMQYDDEYDILDEEVTSAGPQGRHEEFPKRFDIYADSKNSETWNNKSINENHQNQGSSGRKMEDKQNQRQQDNDRQNEKGYQRTQGIGAQVEMFA